MSVQTVETSVRTAGVKAALVGAARPGQTPANDPVSPVAFNYLMDVNRGFGDQLRGADQKAAYIFTFLIAFLVYSEGTRRAFAWTLYAQSFGFKQALSVLLTASLTIALVAAVATVLPRRAAGRSLMFWGAWPKAGHDLHAARHGIWPDVLFEDAMINANTLAELCSRKYRCVQIAFQALLATILAYVGLLVLA